MGARFRGGARWRTGLLFGLALFTLGAFHNLFAAPQIAVASASAQAPVPAGDADAVTPEGVPGDAGHDDESHGAGHSDPFVPILLGFAILVVVALLGRAAAARIDEPTVLGDLMVGVVLGNIGYAMGHPFAVLIMHLESVSQIFRIIWTDNISVGTAAVRIFGNDSGVGEQARSSSWSPSRCGSSPTWG